MDPASIREFAGRDWERVEIEKQRYWTARLAAEGPGALIRAVDHLREFVRSRNPDWPTADERAADLAHHVELNRLLDQARDAFTHR